jgi:hypothetical protein
VAGERRRKRKLEAASDALTTALNGLGLTDQAKRLLIAQCWPAVVGPEIANRTEPDGFSRGVLRVKASSAAWQNELTFLKEEIRSRLNRILGHDVVKDLRVVSGSVKPRPSDEPAWLKEKPTQADTEAAQAMGIAIADPELRRQFEELMCLHLRASRHR